MKDDNNLNDFFKVLAEAKAAAEAEEARLKQLEAEENKKKIEEASPFLSELFNIVVDSKKKIEEKKELQKKVEEPILKQFEQVLQSPPKKNKEKQTEESAIIEESISKASTMLTELEDKAAEIQAKIDALNASDAEKKYLDLFETLHKDLLELKRYVGTLPKNIPFGGMGAGSGSGEVNLRNLDDVDRNSIQDGYYLKYNASTKKFTFVPLSASGGSLQNTYTSFTGDSGAGSTASSPTDSLSIVGDSAITTVVTNDKVQINSGIRLINTPLTGLSQTVDLSTTIKGYYSYKTFETSTGTEVSLVIDETAPSNFTISANADMTGLTFQIRAF